jgi:hypothetical protein
MTQRVLLTDGIAEEAVRIFDDYDGIDADRTETLAPARLLEVMRAHPKGRQAAIIGEVVEDPHGFVQMETGFGGSRVVDWLAGEQLPRIC